MWSSRTSHSLLVDMQNDTVTLERYQKLLRKGNILLNGKGGLLKNLAGKGKLLSKVPGLGKVAGLLGGGGVTTALSVFTGGEDESMVALLTGGSLTDKGKEFIEKGM